MLIRAFMLLLYGPSARALITCAALAFTAASCRAAPEADATGIHVRGQVFDAETRQPIPGAVVSTDPNSVSFSTSTGGGYDLGRLRRGYSYVVRVQKPGYRTAARAFAQTAGDVDLRFDLTPDRLLSDAAQIRSNDASPAGASVNAQNAQVLGRN